MKKIYFHLFDRLFALYRNFTTKHVKKVQNSRFFSLNCQISGFSRFSGHPVLNEQGN